MSPVEKMSYLHSQMQFDEFMASTADSDLEDGELQKLLTSPLYAQRASGKPDAMVVQEREVNAQTSHSSEDHGASRKPAALFSPIRNEQRNQMWSSVFGNVNLSTLGGTLLEGNKDHKQSQARPDLANRELHVKLLNECIDDLQRRTQVQDKALQDVQTNLLNLVEIKLDCNRNCYEKEKSSSRYADSK